MNIIYISDLAGMGGGEISLLHIMKEMQKKHNVSLLCRVDGKLVELAKEEGIEVFCYDFKKNLIQSLLKFHRIINDKKINVVHSNEITTGILHGIILWVLGKRNIKNVTTCHGQWYNISILKQKLMNIFIKHIFCVSRAVEINLHRNGYARTSVTYLGIPEIKTSCESFVSELEKKYNINKKDRLVIVTVGRFQRIKGQMKGVKAIEKLRQAYPNVLYLLVGDSIYGSIEDDQYKQSVIQYIDEHGLGDSVKLLGERSDVLNIMAASDYVLITSDNESFGMVCIEAIAVGRIVVSTPCDGIKEILKCSKEMISKTNNDNGLYDILIKEIEDDDYRERSLETIISRQNIFTVRTVCNKYLDEYV